MADRAPVIPGRPLSQGSVLDVDDAVESIRGAYERADAELRARLERFVTANVDPTIGQAARAQQQSELLSRLSILRAELDDAAGIFAQDTMARVYNGGVSRADRALEIAGISPTGSPSFTAVHRDALETMAADAFDDLAAATDFMEANAKRTIREAAKLRTLVGAAAGDTLARDVGALARTLESRGVSAFVDRAGRSWRLSTYAEMVVRTKSAQAYNTGTVLRAVETGTDVVEIRDGDRSGHAECLAYNGDTASAAWALENPIEHPNCVRTFLPLPLHRGPVDHGARDPERERQRDDDDPPADPIAEAADDDLIARARRDPSLWTRDLRYTRDGRPVPGETALALNRELVSRGAAAERRAVERLRANGVERPTEAELLAARRARDEASNAYGKARDEWVDRKVAEGFEWGDAFEASVNQLLDVDGYTPPPGLVIDDVVVAARDAMREAMVEADRIREQIDGFGEFLQAQLRRDLAEARGTGTAPAEAFVRNDVDERLVDYYLEAHQRLPSEWVAAWEREVGILDVGDYRDKAYEARGWNQTGPIRREIGGETVRTLAARISVPVERRASSTMIHEIGHTLEAVVPGLRQAEWAHLSARAMGPRGGLPKPIQIPHYPRGERFVREAGLPDPYSAKVYALDPEAHYELFTTGLESILGPPSSYSRFVSDDDDFRRWIIGVLFEL